MISDGSDDEVNSPLCELNDSLLSDDSTQHLPTSNSVCLLGNTEPPLLMPNSGRKKYKVLVVDDSTYNLFVMQELLQLITPIRSVTTALNGQEALSVIDENRE